MGPLFHLLSSKLPSARCGNQVVLLHQQWVKSLFSSLRSVRNSCKVTGKVRAPVRSLSKAESFIPQIPKSPMKVPSRGETRDKRQMVLIIIPITTFCLGTWQILRLQWKVDLIDKLERKTRQAPILIPTDILERLEDLEYCRVTLTGHFDHTRELHMWPRTLHTGGDPLKRQNIEPGACVVTPFYCHQLEGWVLVNRGWVSRRMMDPATRPKGQVEGDVPLTAIVRLQEKRATFAPENQPLLNQWSYKDVGAMAIQADSLPLFLDADATTTVPGGPIGGQTRVTVRNEHLQYVFTWYALSLATAYMLYTLWKKSKRR